MKKPAKRPKSSKKTPGPHAETVAVPGDWRMAMRHALNKGKPPEGWPERVVKPRKKTQKRKAK